MVLYDSNRCMYPNTVYHTYVVQAYVEVVELEKKSHMQLIRVSHPKVSETKDHHHHHHHHNNNNNNNTQSQPITTTVVSIDEHGNTSVLNDNNDDNDPKNKITQEENNTPHLTMMSK